MFLLYKLSSALNFALLSFSFTVSRVEEYIILPACNPARKLNFITIDLFDFFIHAVCINIVLKFA